MSTIFAADSSFLTPDSTISEQYAEQVFVTEHPVEDGSTSTDHAQRLPRQITVEALVTESPQSPFNVVDGVQRVIDARNFLNAAVGQLLSYQSDRFGLFENMMLVGFPHAVEKARSIRFQITLKEIRIATFASVEIPAEAPAPAAESGAPSEVDTGEQPTETPDEEKAEDDKSILAGIVDSLFG